jgi:hypothetical protein
MPAPLFIDSLTQARAAGAYAVEIAPPRVVEDRIIGYVGLPMQSEWGPDNVVGEPAGSADFLNTYFPPGSPRTSTGYRALVGRKKMPLRPVRCMKSDAVAASRVITVTGGTFTISARYKGTLGNSITAQVKAATDGDVTHFDLEVVLTNTVTGTTRGTIRNIIVGTNPTLSGDEALLIAAPTWGGTPTATPATDRSPVALSTGSNGTGSVEATKYNAAINLLAARDEILVVVCDDVGSSARASVNARLLLHAQTTTRNRLVVLQDDVSAAWSAVKTTVATVRGDRVLLSGAWVQVYDDSGAVVTSPFSTFIASALANLEPQQSHAWWDDTVTALYSAIVGIVAPFSTSDPDVQAEATEQGITLPIRLESGAFAALHDRTTSLTVGRRYAITRRLKDFFARSILTTIRSFVNGPSLRGRHLEVKALVDGFMGRQVTAGRCVAYSSAIDGVNTPSSLALGQFSIALDAQTPSIMEKIGLLLNAGETVTVREAA